MRQSTKTICDCYSFSEGISDEESQANAELICKAVNERQKLLDSNRDLLEILQCAVNEFEQEKSAYEFLSNGEIIDEPEMITKAKTAINNAKNNIV